MARTADGRHELRVVIEPARSSVTVGGSCPVRVRLRNDGATPTVVNRRLAMGYGDNLSRELFVSLVDASGAEVAVDRLDYNRSFSPPDDYVELPPGAELSTTVDILEWHPIRQAGSYRLVFHYQADEELASPPRSLACGVYSSLPCVIEVEDAPP